MANNIGFSNPSVTINNVFVQIKPNSLKFKVGKPKTVVRSVAGGGGSSQSIHTQDASTMISEVSFELAVTDNNRTLVSGWQDNIGANVFLATQAGMNSIVGVNMSVLDDVEFTASSDGWATVKMAGDPLAEV